MERFGTKPPKDKAFAEKIFSTRILSCLRAYYSRRLKGEIVEDSAQLDAVTERFTK